MNQLNKTSQFISGVEYEEVSVGDRFTTGSGTVRKIWDADKVNELAIYSQWLWRKDDWSFLVGARYFDNKNFGDKLAPRANVVYQLNKISSLKLMYSTGYTSPNFTQLSVGTTTSNVGGDIIADNNKPLKPEIIKMLDFAYQYVSSNIMLVANIFSYQTEDFLTRLPPPTPKYINEQKFRRNGAEIDWQYHSDNWRYYFNLSHNTKGNSINSNDLRSAFIPKTTANIAMRYLNNNHSYGSSLNYINDRHTAIARYDLKFNYQYHWDSLKFTFNITNLLAKEQQAPDIGLFSIGYPNEVKDEKRSINFRVSWVFN